MRKPLEKLLEEIEEHEKNEPDITLGRLAQLTSSSTDRVMDALDAGKIRDGIRTYL